MFFKKCRGKISVLIIYVDDMIITRDDHMEIKELEARLSKEFEMKNLGGLKYFLGIEVSRNKEGIFLSQRKYILDLLTEVGMIDCKPADTYLIYAFSKQRAHGGSSKNPEVSEGCTWKRNIFSKKPTHEYNRLL